MNISGSPPPLGERASCLQLAEGEQSSLVILQHYNHTGRLGTRRAPEEGSGGGDNALLGVFVAASCLVVLENLLVLLAIVTRMRSRRWVYYCIVNITLSDLLTGTAYLVNIVLSGRYTFQLTPYQWFLREGVLFMALAASTFSLLFTAVERFVTMVRLVAENGASKTFRVYGFILLCWLLALLLALLPLLGWNCLCDFPSCSNLLPLYSKWYILFCVVIFSLILAGILLLYGAIFRLVRVTGRQASRGRARQKSQRLLTTVLMILVAFLVCWGPLFALLLADIFGSAAWAREYLRGMDWILTLAVLNSAINPLIYSFRSLEVRRAVLGFLCCGCLRAGWLGPGDCWAGGAQVLSGSSTESSLRPRDSLRISHSLSLRTREPLSSISSVRSL
ncbi:sphingosine 1-phosphate receptor 4 [Tachyglossus aculeatus]|uniref:sphingosine 1-phosphate receptor 4 n=1 Tax=Tachyglossus aculeatus TaxID=9261 RepID=UPI0018F4221A|nr:sphingosine 1-phosphate receptor 4 [Tachyglossus aculeatus]